MVKLAAYETGGRIVDHAVQIFGWRGCMREHSRSSAPIASCAESAS
jgi:alkylation response protein AidB-like acyl-CoA dehydrogenase